MREIGRPSGLACTSTQSARCACHHRASRYRSEMLQRSSIHQPRRAWRFWNLRSGKAFQRMDKMLPQLPPRHGQCNIRLLYPLLLRRSLKLCFMVVIPRRYSNSPRNSPLEPQNASHNPARFPIQGLSRQTPVIRFFSLLTKPIMLHPYEARRTMRKVSTALFS